MTQIRLRSIGKAMATVLPLLLAWGFAAPRCLALTDRAICGSWKTVIHRPNGVDIPVEWRIEPSGAYTVTSFGPDGKRSETGRITTEGSRYFKTTNIGPDNGTFQVLNNREFTTTGRFGFVEWTRNDGAPAADSSSSWGHKPYETGFGNSNPYQTGGYNPELNPRSKTWEKLGFGTAGTTRDQSGFDYSSNALKAYGGGGGGGGFRGADLKTLLFGNFPIKGGGDEVEQFGLPALGQAAAGGMRKRDFRLIQ